MSETPAPESNSSLLDNLYPPRERMVALPANGPDGDSDNEQLRLLEVSFSQESRNEQGELRRVGAVAHVGPGDDPSLTLSFLKEWIGDALELEACDAGELREEVKDLIGQVKSERGVAQYWKEHYEEMDKRMDQIRSFVTNDLPDVPF